MTQPNTTSGPPHRIEIRVRDLGQLFNTMDPSPFHEKDLDADAEEFIVSWAQEFPVRDAVELVVHLKVLENPQQCAELIQRAMRHYFEEKTNLTRLQFRRLMRDAQQFLTIGIVFLVICLTLAHFVSKWWSYEWITIVNEGFIIAGWVAMWRPLEMYLYDWWPVRRRLRVFEKMSRMNVKVLHDPE